MPLTSKIISVWRSLVRKQQQEKDLGDELGSYVEELTERKVRAGMDREGARRAALVEVGGIETVKEKVRERSVGFGIESWIKDVAYAVRGFRRGPAFVAVDVLTLGIGIGSTTALFSLIDAALYRKLPVKNPDELVMLNWTHFGRTFGGSGGPPGFATSLDGSINAAGGNLSGSSFSYSAFEKFRSRQEVLSEALAFYPFEGAYVTIDGYPDVISGQLISDN
jgi:hypothetical protein